MQRPKLQASRRPVRMPALGVLAIVFGAFTVSGCAEVPDYANPVEWYRSVVDSFDDEPRQVRVKAEPVPGASEPFPNLADVPEAPDRDVTLAELGQIGEGLAADREQARYTDEVIRGGALVAAAPPPQPAPQPVTAPQPAPAPVTAPQPTTQAFALSQPAAAAPAPSYAAAQVRAAPPAPTVASRDSVDVRSLFASLFAASGPRAVAPSPAGGQFAAAAVPVPPPAGGGSLAPRSGAGGLAPPPSTVSQSPVVTAAAAPGTTVKAAVIYFAVGSARLSAKAREALHEVAHLQRDRGGAIRVVGHASSRTREVPLDRHALINFDISHKRAQAAATELVRRGVPRDRVFVKAQTDTAPVYHEWMPSGEAGNRRAEIFIVY